MDHPESVIVAIGRELDCLNALPAPVGIQVFRFGMILRLVSL